MLPEYNSPGELSLLTPYSVVGVRRKKSASERLALAVVSQAVNDVALYQNTRYAWSRRVYRDAWRWIFSDDRLNTFSFINLCEALGLSPGNIRAGVNMIIRRQEADARNAA
jgi:hypothetical protein